MKANLIIIATLVTSLCTAAYAATTPATPTTPATVGKTTTVSPVEAQKIQEVVHNYLVQNPEVVVESLQVYQQKQMDEARKSMQKTQAMSPKFADSLFKQVNDPSIGNQKGTVTLVEFFDYQCPHCVDMTPIVEGLIKANTNLRVVLKELPIRGPVSEFAAKATLAAKNQGKYLELHKALMDNKERLTQEAILAMAKTAGINVTTLQADMKTPAVEQAIKANITLAQQLGLMGTPAFFVAKSDVSKTSAPDAIVFIPGQVDQAQLQALIEKVAK